MRRLLLALLPALAAGSAAAERRQFGNVVYDLPADWSQGRSDEGCQALFFGGDEEVCPYRSLSIGAGEPAQGDLANWLRRRSLASWTRTSGPPWRSSPALTSSRRAAGRSS